MLNLCQTVTVMVGVLLATCWELKTSQLMLSWPTLRSFVTTFAEAPGLSMLIPSSPPAQLNALLELDCTTQCSCPERLVPWLLPCPWSLFFPMESLLGNKRQKGWGWGFVTLHGEAKMTEKRTVHKQLQGDTWERIVHTSEELYRK